jgi:hypothetical protein
MKHLSNFVCNFRYRTTGLELCRTLDFCWVFRIRSCFIYGTSTLYIDIENKHGVHLTTISTPLTITQKSTQETGILPLHCQQCKQRLINYLGKAFLEITPSYLQNEQRLYVAGCEIGGTFERSLYSTHQPFHIPDPSLRCNEPEADTCMNLVAEH